MLGFPELIIILMILLTVVAPIALLAFIAWRLVRKPQS